MDKSVLFYGQNFEILFLSVNENANRKVKQI